MGGPILGTCLGRVDEADGAWSESLGPSELQQEVAPCGDLEGDDGGDCQGPFGATTLRLIYVNPGGPFGNFTDLAGSAMQSRSSFGRMAMNDTETVALIGGGHAFGKAHGLCPEGSGPPPKDQPWDPWPGNCGVDKPHTSGFEGPWTETPDQWSNLYFTYLQTIADQYEPVVGPSGNVVWNLKDRDMLTAPGTRVPGDTEPVMMLSSDLALLHDPKGSYQKIVKEFADDIKSLEHHFAHSWYKLTTRDMGPISRCVGPDTAAVQPWQFPLPEAPDTNATDWMAVKKAVNGVMEGNMYKFVRLALRCASTYRATDYRGGCNGARIRFAPEKEWPINKGLDAVLDTLAPIYKEFADLSWADLIVYAGTMALEAKGAPKMPFCPGRTDAADGAGSENLEPWSTGAFDDTLANLKHAMTITGLSLRESVALMGTSAIGEMHPSLRTYMYPSNPKSANLTSKFYDALLGEDWGEFTLPSGEKQFKARGKDLYGMKTEVMLGWDAELLDIAQEYAVDEAAFKAELATAWTKLMTSDRFDGPTGNVCDEINAELSKAPVCVDKDDAPRMYVDEAADGDAAVIAAAVVGAIVGAGLFVCGLVILLKQRAKAAATGGKMMVEADVGPPKDETDMSN